MCICLKEGDGLGKYVECPYYKYHKKKIIVCEDRAMKFNDPIKTREYLKEFCGEVGNYHKCQLAKHYNNKYGVK